MTLGKQLKNAVSGLQTLQGEMCAAIMSNIIINIAKKCSVRLVHTTAGNVCCIYECLKNIIYSVITARKQFYCVSILPQTVSLCIDFTTS